MNVSVASPAFSVRRSLRRCIAASAALLLLASCAQAQPPGFGERIDMGPVENDLVNEASGLAAGRRNPGVLWTHNDSGDTTRIFAVGTDGRDLGEFYLAGASARDWEEIAVGPGPQEGVSYIYVGEIGDNNAAYDTKRIYRVPEPQVDSGAEPTTQRLDGVETITYRYPDGPRDAEAMFVDPATRDIYIVSKREASVRVYRAPWPQSLTETITLEQVATLDGLTMINGGDISADGKEVLLKNYTNIFYWRRADGKGVGEMFAAPPDTVPYVVEPQGEAVAWAADGSGYFTVSEEPQNIPARLYFYPRRETSGVREEKGMGEYRSGSSRPDLTAAAGTEEKRKK